MELTYHDYKRDDYIAVDIETKDPYLLEKGNGVYRRDGYVVGVSFANKDIEEYYPIRHLDTSSEDKEKNTKYIAEQLSSRNNKIFANGMYDLDWLINYENISVNGTYEDVQIAEPLLNEYRPSYSLNSLAEDYLEKEKLYDKITEYCEEQKWPLTKKQKGISHLWKIPYGIVKEYASEDARLTYDIFKLQISSLEKQNLLQLYRLEMNLFPLLLQMRKTGVRIDNEKLIRTGIELSDLSYDLENELCNLAGFKLNINSGQDLEKLFKKLNLPIKYGEPTELMLYNGKTRGNPSFSKQILSKLDNSIAKKILELRHIKTLLNMFIHPYSENLLNGRLHCNFNPLRSDNYGTVSGRFSSSNVNLQQVSGKEEEDHIHSDSEILNGLIVRKLFIPEENCDWLKMDWNQIEYRFIAHYAKGKGSEHIRKRYNENPNVDYHDELMDMTEISKRKTIKILNFGAAYGMGWRTMSKTFGWNESEAKQVYEMYHRKVPFVKETSNKVSLRAKKMGYIRTILNRRARLLNSGKAYTMFNRLIQGSAADIMKKSMVDAYEAGVFNILTPHITVHDEMDCSIPKTKEGQEAGKEMKYIMENCIDLRVPIKVDCEIGKNWGEVKEWNI